MANNRFIAAVKTLFGEGDDYVEKLNPAQPDIQNSQGQNINNTEVTYNYQKAYDRLEVVRRGVDMCVNGASSFDINVMDRIDGYSPTVGQLVRKQKLNTLLNFAPNPFQDISRFRRLIFMDLFLEGNIFIYWDGLSLYHIPAQDMTILTDPKTYVAGYRYKTTMFKPEEIIHISDNSSDSIYRGKTRLASAYKSIKSLISMLDFQDNTFNNSAVPGLVISSPNVLGDRMKERLITSWQAKYNPRNGGKRPLVLDGGLKVESIGALNFAELDFVNSCEKKEKIILQALGVPVLLLDGGNNANISPNLRLFYLETIYPVVKMVTTALERFFGYDMEPETGKVSALQPDMKEASQYFTTLVNGGVITPNEARAEMRRLPIDGGDTLRIPANIAGSASDPSAGGRPPDTGTNQTP